MAATEITLRITGAIGDVAAAAWDACANPVERAPDTNAGSKLGSCYNPFISHDFLSSLEESGSARQRTGWQPMHLLVEDSGGELLGAAPCYAKSHSQGEYVFDRGWVCRRSKASSVHVTFLPLAEWQLLGEHGYLRRTHRQFHWENAGYATFEDFLTALASRKRKTIRRERADALASGITIHWLTGAELTESIWDAFFDFYMETGSRKWGRPYLTREFYSIVGQKMADRILLVMAKRNGRWVAGAINFIGGDTLFGRHWGCSEEHPFLHFEVCYYQAIDYAIAHKLARVEAGAQGQHKIARGYLPVTTYSAHYIVDPALRRAVDDFLKHERRHIEAEIEEFAEFAPFRKGEQPAP
jgi:predicted N-acyltransferase